MNDKRLLLLFVRAPELGKVKTRLAEAVGPEVALEIYIHLLQHTLHFPIINYLGKMAQPMLAVEK